MNLLVPWSKDILPQIEADDDSLDTLMLGSESCRDFMGVYGVLIMFKRDIPSNNGDEMRLYIYIHTLRSFFTLLVKWNIAHV